MKIPSDYTTYFQRLGRKAYGDKILDMLHVEKQPRYVRFYLKVNYTCGEWMVTLEVCIKKIENLSTTT